MCRAACSREERDIDELQPDELHPERLEDILCGQGFQFHQPPVSLPVAGRSSNVLGSH